jgi:putative phage-type endonuclease
MLQVEQRTNEWFELRLGRFTGSEIHKLMGIKGLGLTGEGYAFSKACELVFGRDEEDSFMSFDMQRGVQYEPLAFECFNRLNEENFINAQQCEFFVYDTFAGASPDGIVSDNAVLEIKCPKPETLFELIATNEIDKKYQYQMQMEMLCAEKDKAYFFNYGIWNGKEIHHTVIIERDEEIISKIKERVLEALILRDKYVEQIKTNLQFNLI